MTYRVPPEETWQLQNGDQYGGSNCSAWSMSALINKVTQGRKNPGGARIRQLTDEPIPDKGSPGLTIPQVADVAETYFGVHIDERIGWRSLTWDEYEAERINGKPALIQVEYFPIAQTEYDAGGGFTGNHMLFEDQSFTYDPLADGRRAGIHRWDGRLYPRALMRQAAGRLVIRYDAKGHAVSRVGDGRVWCAFGADQADPYRLDIPKARTVNAYRIVNGRITGVDPVKTTKTTARCDPPRVVRWPGKGARYVVLARSGPLKGRYVHAHHAVEV